LKNLGGANEKGREDLELFGEALGGDGNENLLREGEGGLHHPAHASHSTHAAHVGHSRFVLFNLTDSGLGSEKQARD
jgi:hypothetical protein